MKSTKDTGDKQLKKILIGLWTLAALYAAYQRSFWGDEYNRYGQTLMGFTDSLRNLFSEPSPFTPGEHILMWLSARVFGGILPAEVWGRLPSIVWGVFTLAISLTLTAVAPYLFWLLFFSVSLFMFSAEVRPYASLIASGAVALHILYADKPKRWLAWIALAFFHIYGVCFVAFACFVRRWFAPVVVAGTTVVLLLKIFKVGNGTPTQVTTGLLFEYGKQIAGVMSNPHRASILMVPVALLGVATLFTKRATVFKKLTALRAFAIIALTGIAIIGPLLASLRSGYFFVPRQVLGAMVPFLFFVALGITALESCTHFKKFRVGAVFVLVAGVVPFVLSVILARPPFPNQPFHRFRQVARDAVAKGARNVMVADACNETNIAWYFTRAIEMHYSHDGPIAPGPLLPADKGLARQCWSTALTKNVICVTFLKDMQYCSLGSDAFGPGSLPDRAIREAKPPFDVVIYNTERLDRTDVKTVRGW